MTKKHINKIKKTINNNKKMFELLGRLSLYEALQSKQEKIREIRERRLKR